MLDDTPILVGQTFYDLAYAKITELGNETYSFVLAHELDVPHNEAVAALVRLWQAGRVQITAIEASAL